jgi:hypothetical protein
VAHLTAYQQAEFSAEVFIGYQTMLQVTEDATLRIAVQSLLGIRQSQGLKAVYGLLRIERDNNAPQIE